MFLLFYLYSTKEKAEVCSYLLVVLPPCSHIVDREVHCVCVRAVNKGEQVTAIVVVICVGPCFYFCRFPQECLAWLKSIFGEVRE